MSVHQTAADALVIVALEQRVARVEALAKEFREMGDHAGRRATESMVEGYEVQAVRHAEAQSTLYLAAAKIRTALAPEPTP